MRSSPPGIAPKRPEPRLAAPASRWRPPPKGGGRRSHRVHHGRCRRERTAARAHRRTRPRPHLRLRDAYGTLFDVYSAVRCHQGDRRRRRRQPRAVAPKAAGLRLAAPAHRCSHRVTAAARGRPRPGAGRSQPGRRGRAPRAAARRLPRAVPGCRCCATRAGRPPFPPTRRRACRGHVGGGGDRPLAGPGSEREGHRRLQAAGRGRRPRPSPPRAARRGDLLCEIQLLGRPRPARSAPTSSTSTASLSRRSACPGHHSPPSARSTSCRRASVTPEPFTARARAPTCERVGTTERMRWRAGRDWTTAACSR